MFDYYGTYGILQQKHGNKIRSHKVKL